MKFNIFLLLMFSAFICMNTQAAIIHIGGWHHFSNSAENTTTFHRSIFIHPVLSETIATATISDKSEAVTGNLATVAAEGFYKVSFQVTVNRQPAELGLLTIRFTYTGAESGEELIAPESDVENINLMLADTTNKGGLNSSLLLHVAAGSQVSYSVSYASSPSPEEDAGNAMQYSLNMVLEKL